MHRKSLGFLLASILGTGVAGAQGEKSVSLTLSSFHLLLPVVEAMGEYALDPKLGIAGIGGFGRITQMNSAGEGADMPVLELGAQIDYYLIGGFRHGMQVGAEILWLELTPPEDLGVTAPANGLSLGPFLGYKWASRSGFTILIQGGYKRLFFQKKTKDSSGMELDGFDKTGIPLINLNVGWSF